jgi:hypothetical protein
MVIVLIEWYSVINAKDEDEEEQENECLSIGQIKLVVIR